MKEGIEMYVEAADLAAGQMPEYLILSFAYKLVYPESNLDKFILGSIWAFC